MSEEVVWSGKPTVVAFYDALVGGALLIIASVLLLATPLSFLYALWALGLAFGLALTAVAFIKAAANTYTVTGRSVRREYRFVAVKVEEAPLEKVTNVVVEQDVVGRLLNFGDIRFDTAGTAFAGVFFRGVKNPADAKRLIDDRLKNATRRSAIEGA